MVLSKLKYKIKEDIKRIEEHWETNPNNDYYFAEICGMRSALDHIARAEAEELTELDKWASQQQGRERDATTTRDRTGS
jgi:transcription initiation factor IIE alpha subunit|tara:strand:- start:155 stop:391 length:237 start_codon:yes stop_codon:yes gene_type:complete